MSEAFGMMEGAYFVGKREVLEFINQTLALNLSKIEETASGCVALQLLDSIYPGKVPMSKVNWAAKQDFEFVQNYKILQKCFDQLKVDKFIDVDKLIRGKYQDNLEFMQWFKRYYEVSGPPEGYDPVAARAKGRGAPGATSSAGGAVRSKPAARPAVAAAGAAVGGAAAAPRKTSGTGTKATSSSSSSSGMKSRLAPASSTTTRKSSTGGSVSQESEAMKAELATKDEEVAALKAQMEELKMSCEALEKERDFYFEKLRDVEILIQLREEKGSPIEGAADIVKILYASTEDIVAVNDDGEVIEGEAARLHKEAAGGEAVESAAAPDEGTEDTA